MNKQDSNAGEDTTLLEEVRKLQRTITELRQHTDKRLDAIDLALVNRIYKLERQLEGVATADIRELTDAVDQWKAIKHTGELSNFLPTKKESGTLPA